MMPSCVATQPFRRQRLSIVLPGTSNVTGPNASCCPQLMVGCIDVPIEDNTEAGLVVSFVPQQRCRESPEPYV